MAWYQGEEDERPAGAGEDRRVALVRVAAVDALLVLLPLTLLLVRALPVHLPVGGLDLLLKSDQFRARPDLFSIKDFHFKKIFTEQNCSSGLSQTLAWTCSKVAQL